MQAVILAGGLGTRLSEETQLKPKPMVEIGGYPILWHIMKIYSAYNIHDFVICLGYKGYLIKEYFANYALHMSDVTFDLKKNTLEVHERFVEPWRITLVDTGLYTQTGGRLKRIRQYITEDDFLMTYGDGLADVNIANLIDFHRQHHHLATVTAVQPLGRFGALSLNENNTKVTAFLEKPTTEASWISGGFFVLNKRVFDYIAGDEVSFERYPLAKLAEEGHLGAYRHHGFWQPMDTLREKTELESMWNAGTPPWRVWE